MCAAGPITQDERDYANAVRGMLPVAEIARNLGRSRPSVYKMFSEEPPPDCVNEDPGPAENQPPPGGAGGGGAEGGNLARLKWLRARLRDALAEADPKTIPALAREYRATIEAIERIEGDGGDGLSDAIGTIATALASKLSA